MFKHFCSIVNYFIQKHIQTMGTWMQVKHNKLKFYPSKNQREERENGCRGKTVKTHL